MLKSESTQSSFSGGVFLLVFLFFFFFFLVIAATYRRLETTELSGEARRTVREKFIDTCKDFKRYCKLR